MEVEKNLIDELNNQSIIDNGNNSIYQRETFPGEPRYITGLTKREYIAIQIMSNMGLANAEDAAERSVRAADILLRELAKKNQ